MALESSDVFVVQKQTGNKENRKLSVAQLSTYLSSSPAVVYKGTANMTVSGDEPSPVAIGDLYVNDAATAGAFAWTTGSGYTGQVVPNARALWNGTGWDVTNPSASDIGVESIGQSDPITVDNSNPAVPVVGVNTASTTGSGVVTIAKDEDVTAGLSNVVVTAAQLYTTNQAISNAGGGTVTNVAGAVGSPITTTNPSASVIIDIATATTSVKGATTLTDDSVITTADNSTAATPKYVDTYYLIKDFSLLADA